MSPTEVYFKIKVSEIIIMDMLIFDVLEVLTNAHR